ncbi:uncharacterized protein LOC131673009 isoform X2 [Phymastichus coffea]|uniref:uncharacterized protein LOC131673009 isoform X2 n=1 Tax=Phymastichus coffea TaxID=108790 RepID=UPI00273C251B|nr:uncharacterized protein LOC131673009 isoform X2 [Phymastichus coffea]
MGICLDTDQQDGSQVFEEAGAQDSEKWRREAGILATPPGGNFPQRNTGRIKFEQPTVPVVFVLGGPGSGKVTHCDNLMQEKKGIVHINMTDLLQQYVLGNGMVDFGMLSSKVVTEVLMLEMRMSPEAKTFLVSGYPRNISDVVEYSEKIQIVNGVIMVAWRQEVLEEQIEYGARLGQVIIELARQELKNFFNDGVPVAEYFNASGMLYMVNGERNPSEVYVDFREAVMTALGLTNEGGPPRQVSSSMEAEVEVERRQDDGERTESSPTARRGAVIATSAPVVEADEILPSRSAGASANSQLPPIVWVLGGPGSNKAVVCRQAVRQSRNWVHLSMGSLLVTMSASDPTVRDALVAGELVSSDFLMSLLEQQIDKHRGAAGIVIDGFPRDSSQARDFENKFGIRPVMLLLDVSKQQPNRGRIYDSAEAFERRLMLFRELSLPMLKSFDREGRLSIVEGDTELPADRQQFAKALLELMRRVSRNEDDPNRISVLESEIEDADQRTAKSTANGVVKPLANGAVLRANEATVGNGVAGARKVMANGGSSIKNATGKVIAVNRRQQQQQQQQRQQNGNPTAGSKLTANGGLHLLQNGVTNGFLPRSGNRVNPMPVDPLRRMYSEVEGAAGPPVNLHI